MSAHDITGFLRSAYRPFAYCVPSKKTEYCVPKKRGDVTLIKWFGSFHLHGGNCCQSLQVTYYRCVTLNSLFILKYLHLYFHCFNILYRTNEVHSSILNTDLGLDFRTPHTLTSSNDVHHSVNLSNTKFIP